MKPETQIILAEKLKKEHISQRSKGQTSLSYIESHHAIREANRAFGFDGWSYQIITLDQVSEEKNSNDNNVIGYISRVRVLVGDVSREDVGFGSGISKMLADAHEGATKEAVSDAMKRALRTYGDIFGLALYDKKQEHVEKNAPKKELTFLESIDAAKKVIGETFVSDCLTSYKYNSAKEVNKEDEQAILKDLRKQAEKVRKSQGERG